MDPTIRRDSDGGGRTVEQSEVYVHTGVHFVRKPLLFSCSVSARPCVVDVSAGQRASGAEREGPIESTTEREWGKHAGGLVWRAHSTLGALGIFQGEPLTVEGGVNFLRGLAGCRLCCAPSDRVKPSRQSSLVCGRVVSAIQERRSCGFDLGG